MPIRYSSVVGGSGGTGFNLDIGASGNTTFYFDTPQTAGGYSITSQLADSSIEFYAIAEDGTLAGYTNTKALSATKDFDTLVVYGATTNDLITFEYKATSLPTASGDQDSGAAPYIDSVSDIDLPNINDTTIVTGGNFATDVVVTFTGTDAVVRNPKSVVRTNSTQLIVTRTDDMVEDYAPYTLTISNPGIPQSVINTYAQSVTVGSDPVWSTASGALSGAVSGEAYSVFISASDAESSVTYTLVSGSLPPGFSLSANGTISGTGAFGNSGTYTFTVTATDLGNNISERSFSIFQNDPIAATGGTISDSNGYRYHTFTASDTLAVTYAPAGTSTVELLIVGGGASGGGYYYAGGGGAGGYLAISETVSQGSYPITIGAGGAAVGTSTSKGNGGTNTEAFSKIAYGGGGGGYNENRDGLNGGSGGGAGGAQSGSGTGGSPTQPGSAFGGLGNRGGNTNNVNFGGYGGGTGGGGANSAGEDISGSVDGGNGGNGQQWLNGNTYAGGGGGGGGNNSSGNGGNGGSGGGGNGAAARGVSSQAGTVNTGGGGGGGSHTVFGAAAGSAGGSGIVIVRYPY